MGRVNIDGNMRKDRTFRRLTMIDEAGTLDAAVRSNVAAWDC